MVTATHRPPHPTQLDLSSSTPATNVKVKDPSGTQEMKQGDVTLRVAKSPNSPLSPRDESSEWLRRKFLRSHTYKEGSSRNGGNVPVISDSDTWKTPTSQDNTTSAPSHGEEGGPQGRQHIQDEMKHAEHLTSDPQVFKRPRQKSVKFKTEKDAARSVSSTNSSDRINLCNVLDGEYSEAIAPSERIPIMMRNLQRGHHVRVKTADSKSSSRNPGNPDAGANTAAAVSVYEVKGNAISTPPPRQGSARRVGLFSASFEAFKRRLRVSSSKHTQRLYGQEMEGVDSYIVSPAEKHVPDHQLQLQPPATAQQHAPPHEPPTLKKAPKMSSLSSTPVHITKGQTSLTATLKIRNKSAKHNYDDPHVNPTYTEYPDRLHNFFATPTDRDFIHKREPRRDFTRREKNVIRANKIMNTASAPAKFTYKLPEDGALKDDSFEFEDDDFKLPLPSVKTYVLENDDPSAFKAKLSRPVPLSIHNLKLHDSLNTIFEKRNRIRVHKVPKFRGQRASSTNSDGSNGGDSERMRKWLSDVAEHADPPPLLIREMSMDDIELVSQTQTFYSNYKHSGYTDPIVV